MSLRSCLRRLSGVDLQVFDLIASKAPRSQIASLLEQSIDQIVPITRALVKSEYLPAEDALQQKLVTYWNTKKPDPEFFASLAHVVRRSTLAVTPEESVGMLEIFSSRISGELEPALVADFITAFAWSFSGEITDPIQRSLTPLYEYLESRKFLGISDHTLFRLLEVAGSRLGDFALVGNIVVEISDRDIAVTDFLGFFGVLGRLDFFDERFLNLCNRKFLEFSDQFTAHDIVQAFNHLPRYANVLDGNLEISSTLISKLKVNELAESALVNVLIGLHRRRPGNSLTPEITTFLTQLKPRILGNFSVPGKATGICLISKLMTPPCDVEFLSKGIEAIVSAKKLEKLTVSHTQQLLAIIAHNKAKLTQSLIDHSACVLIDHLTSMAPYISPVHAISIMAAMNTLTLRDERALNILLSLLAGRNRHSRGRTEFKLCGPDIAIFTKEFPIKLSACIAVLTPADGSIDLTHLACTVHAICELEAYSEISVNLIFVIRALLLKSGLHNLRAGSLANLIQVWSEISPFISDQAIQNVDVLVESHFDNFPNEKFRAKIPTFLTKSQFMLLLIENLRRHDNYMRSHPSTLRRVQISLLAVTEHVDDDEFIKRVLAYQSADLENENVHLDFVGSSPEAVIDVGSHKLHENFRISPGPLTVDVLLAHSDYSL